MFFAYGWLDNRTCVFCAFGFLQWLWCSWAYDATDNVLANKDDCKWFDGGGVRGCGGSLMTFVVDKMMFLDQWLSFLIAKKAGVLGLMIFAAGCKQRWCSWISDLCCWLQTKMMFLGQWPSLLVAKKDDVIGLMWSSAQTKMMLFG